MSLVSSIAGFFGYKPATPQHLPLTRGPRVAGRNYGAADQNRLTMDFQGTRVSADTSLVNQLCVMRARSRKLFTDEPYARRYTRLIEKNVAGPAGVQLSISGGPDAEYLLSQAEAAAIERRWKYWICSPWLMVSRKGNWSQVQRKALRNCCIDGEVFVRVVGDETSPYFIALDWFAADQFDEQFNSSLPNGGEIRMSIEFDSKGRRVAYHPFKRNPVDYLPGSRTRGMGERIRVPAEEVIHFHLDDLIQQSRGVPWLFATIARINMLGGYEEAELVASRVAASKMGFLVNPEGGPEYTGDGQDAQGNTITEAQPGTFESLPFGTELKSFDPQHPNGNFAAFIKAMLRGISMGGDVSYHTLSGDLEGVNYSSARVGLLDERDGYAMLQDEFIQGFCLPVFRSWLIAQATIKAVPLSVDEARTFSQIVWRPRKWRSVDPVKDIAADVQSVALRVKSRTQIVAESGGTFPATLAELEAEEEAIEAAGLMQPATPIPGSVPPKKGKEEEDDEDEEQVKPKPQKNGRFSVG